jgi:hypothetical protein
MSLNFQKEYKKTISFGKVDGYNIGRKNCEVMLTMNLTEDNCFSVSGELWNNLHTDIIRGGQCINALYNDFPELQQNKLYCEIMELWQKYHLNDMKAGTPEQERAIKEWKAQGNVYNYEKVCDYLKSIDLYEVPLDGKLYKYGSGWLKEEIPENDLLRIKEIMEIPKLKIQENEFELEL